MKGVGPMLDDLFGLDGSKFIQGFFGKKITAIYYDDDELALRFGDEGLCIWDNGQSCCENRYMTTDDDLTYFLGAELRDIEVREGPDLPSDECHEQEFLVVTTSLGAFTMENHVEHNGYYGGFSLTVKPL